MMKLFLSAIKPLPCRRSMISMVQQFNFGAKKSGKDTMSGSDTESKNNAKPKKTARNTGSDSDRRNASDSEGRKAVPLDQSFFNFANKQNPKLNETKQNPPNNSQTKPLNTNSSQNNTNPSNNNTSKVDQTNKKEKVSFTFEPIPPKKTSSSSYQNANDKIKNNESVKPNPPKEAPQKVVDTTNVLTPEKPELSFNQGGEDKTQTYPRGETIEKPQETSSNLNDKVESSEEGIPQETSSNLNEKLQSSEEGKPQETSSNLNEKLQSSDDVKKNEGNLPDDLIGNIKVIETVQGHRVPLNEDTIGGRYASTLFVVSSQEKALFKVFRDMKYINALYERMESFRIFSDNSGLNASQINSFIQEISAVGEFCETTMKFCDLVAKNKRFMYINEIAKKYIKLYLLLTKEEKITIISAYPLTNEQKDDVKNSLMANKENEGKTFIIDYEVNPNLMGGLQMYTENKFMDLSLSSRIDKIKEEINKLI